MNRYPELNGRVAVITGAGRKAGLGEGIARRLAAEGCTVVITDIGTARGDQMPEAAIGTQSEMEQIAEQIRTDGGQCDTRVMDVLDGPGVERCMADIRHSYGRLDILVNNAGIGYLMKPILEMSLEEWDAVIGVNLRGAFVCTKYAIAHMQEQGAGRIVNIASQAAKSGFPYASAYCSSKHGLVGLTRVSAIELGGQGITVNALCPNHVTTGLGAWQNEYFADALGLSLEQYMANMKSRIPLGRPGLPQDTAAACAWLCSDEARYISGEAMNVSGGEEMH